MTRRDRTALIVVLIAAAIGVYWFLLLSPKREQASAVRAQVTQQERRLRSAEADLAASQAARATYSADYASVARLGKAVPADDDVASLVYQLDRTAGGTGVDFRAIKVTSSTGGGAPAAPPPAASRNGKGPASSPSTQQASGPPAAAPPAQGATAGLPPGAVVGPAGLATMPFSFRFEGSFFRLSDFFGRVQRFIAQRRGGFDVSGRLLTLDGLAVTFSNRGYPHMKATVAATAYLLPASEGLLNGASPAAPGQAAAQPVRSGGATAPTTPATVRGP